jgi:uncharacterized protein (TIGR00251 family)
MSFATDAPDGCTLALRVHPGAKRDAIAGLHDGQLKVSLTPPPTDGRANEALIRLLAERLGIRCEFKASPPQKRCRSSSSTLARSF